MIWKKGLRLWLEKDISIISTDLLVIGRQIETDFGGVIDLLCIDPNGDLVIMGAIQKSDKMKKCIKSEKPLDSGQRHV